MLSFSFENVGNQMFKNKTIIQNKRSILLHFYFNSNSAISFEANK